MCWSLTSKMDGSGQSGQFEENCRGRFKKLSNRGCSWAEEFTALLELFEVIFQEDKSCPTILLKIEKIMKIKLKVK